MAQIVRHQRGMFPGSADNLCSEVGVGAAEAVDGKAGDFPRGRPGSKDGAAEPNKEPIGP